MTKTRFAICFTRGRSSLRCMYLSDNDKSVACMCVTQSYWKCFIRESTQKNRNTSAGELTEIDLTKKDASNKIQSSIFFLPENKLSLETKYRFDNRPLLSKGAIILVLLIEPPGAHFGSD